LHFGVLPPHAVQSAPQLASAAHTAQTPAPRQDLLLPQAASVDA